jgi:hypothetical protein
MVTKVRKSCWPKPCIEENIAVDSYNLLFGRFANCMLKLFQGWPIIVAVKAEESK